MNTNDHEQEVKFYLADKAALEARLAASGAELVRKRTFERNLRFDTPKNKLQGRKQLLRLRQDHTARLTFKGPSTSEDGVISRREIEVEIGNFDAGQRLLEALGYRVTVIYEKYRTTYAMEGLEITLDELPFGDFLEIEGESGEAIRAFSGRLGLDGSRAIEQNYLGLFKNCQRQLKFDFRDLTFENFTGLQVSAAQLGVQPADQD